MKFNGKNADLESDQQTWAGILASPFQLFVFGKIPSHQCQFPYLCNEGTSIYLTRSVDGEKYMMHLLQCLAHNKHLKITPVIK